MIQFIYHIKKSKDKKTATPRSITHHNLEYGTMDGVSGETIELGKPVVGSGISFNAGLTLTFN